MNQQPVVITGAGLVTAAGNTMETWQAIKNGCSAVQWVDLNAGVRYPVRLPGAIITHEYWPADLPKPKRFKSIPEVIKITLAAAHEAVSMAQLESVDSSRVGVVIGTSLAAAELGIQNHLHVMQGQDSRYLINGIQALPNMLGYYLANVTNRPFTGPNVTIAGACAAGLQAIGMGKRMLQAGEADVVLVGGADYLFRTDFPSALLTFNSIGVLGQPTDSSQPWTACRPFAGDENNGFILGNGAGVLVLELQSDALSRGGKPLGRISGFAQGVDPSSPAKPDEDATQAQFVISQALKMARVPDYEVDFIIPHGVGTIGDRAEALAICNTVGWGVPVTSNKPIAGHTMAASGIISVTEALYSMNEGVVPGTLNHSGGMRMDLDIPSKTVGGYQIGNILINAFGLGGQLATVIVSS